MNSTNQQIRRAIRNYVRRYGKQDTRRIISLFAKTFHTTKQRISGNLSCMHCIERSIQILPNRPHSILYFRPEHRLVKIP